jgi:hypothetical protein
MPPNINLSIETNRSLLGLARRSTLICCLRTRISASSATCDRNKSLAIPKINRHKSSIGYQHRAIPIQLPARLNLRQGQVRLRSGVSCGRGPEQRAQVRRSLSRRRRTQAERADQRTFSPSPWRLTSRYSRQIKPITITSKTVKIMRPTPCV